MHRPAPLTRPLRPFRVGFRGLGGPGIGLKVAAALLVVLAVLWVVAVYTPIAHPRDLEVNGATGLSASQIRTAIEEEANRQSTFTVSRDDLMAAVAPYPEVADIKVAAHPPFRLDLTVVMRPPVARVQIGGRSFTVAGDGTVLQRANEAAVPKLDDSLGSLLMRDGRLTGDGGALRVLSTAPETLLELIRTVRRGNAGLEIELQRGPRLIFGSADGAADKWAAATAVIADGAATRATYIDVRVPGRPAVGGLGASKTAGAPDAPPTLTANATATADTIAPAAPAAPATQTGTGGAAGANPAGATPQTNTSSPSAQTATPPNAQTPQTQAPSAPATPTAPSGAADTSAPTGGASVTGGATP